MVGFCHGGNLPASHDDDDTHDGNCCDGDDGNEIDNDDDDSDDLDDNDEEEDDKEVTMTSQERDSGNGERTATHRNSAKESQVIFSQTKLRIHL